MNRTPNTLLAFALLFLSTIANAADFSITPVRVQMAPKDRAVAITVANEGGEELVVQSELFEWLLKPNGDDLLTPTDDIVLTPPIAKIPPNSRQVFRLLRVGAPPAEEKTYRLVVREVPEVKPHTAAGAEIQLALAFSVPIFITPAGSKPQLLCEVRRSSVDVFSAQCENKGNSRVLIRELLLVDTSGSKLAHRERGGYLLAGTKRTFELAASRPTRAGHAKLQLSLDDGTSPEFDVEVKE